MDSRGFMVYIVQDNQMGYQHEAHERGGRKDVELCTATGQRCLARC